MKPESLYLFVQITVRSAQQKEIVVCSRLFTEAVAIYTVSEATEQSRGAV